MRDWPLPYVTNLELRSPEAVDLIVMHCTELPDLATARQYGERVLYDSGSGNSGHCYIDRDGAVFRFVPFERIAHHVRGFNARSIGIELVNIGRFPDWLSSQHQAMDEAYPDAQIDALIALLHTLQNELPNLRFIAGHEDLDREYVEACDDASRKVPRKRDPGPLFPWDRVLMHVPLERL